MKKLAKINPKKNNYLLGIQSFATMDTGACILKFDNKGKILDYIAISEERLLRKKYPYTFPILSIQYCLDYFRIRNLKDISFIISDWIRENRWIRSGPSYNYQEFDYIKEKLKFDKNKIIQIDHHLAHAASTFYTSGFRKSAVLIVDGNGSDLETNSYYVGNKNKLTLIEKFKNQGIGAVYSAVTKEILNLGTGSEGKTMGLAPYGKKNKKIKIKYKLNGIRTDFSQFMRKMPYSDVLNQINNEFRPKLIKFKHKKANKQNIMKKYFADWAFEVQDVSEKVLCHLAKDLKNKTKLNNITVAGGVALNCVANQKLFKKNKFKNIFVFPACSDAGIPFGLTIWAYYNIFNGKKKEIKYKNAYSGREYMNSEIIKILKKFKIRIKTISVPEIAKLISKKYVIGNFNGGSEYGPRALGNRSILADARDPNMRDYINNKVKHREIFRPFAPAILEEKSSKFFDVKYSPFMLQVAKVKKPELIPSAIHVDNSARVQTVNKDQNEKFYNIIKEFDKLTGIPCILNTSFNDAGEPLVETPLDALICFFKTKIDFLILNDFIIDKKKYNIKNLINELSLYRDQTIRKNLKLSSKNLTKNFNKKELHSKIKSENQIAIHHTLQRPILKLKKFHSSTKNKKILIIGTNDHTYVLQLLLPDFNNINVDYLEINKNDFNNKKYKIKFKKITKIKKIKNYKKVFISSFEFKDEIIEKYNLRNYFTPYDNSSRSIIDFLMIKNKISLKEVHSYDFNKLS